MIMLIKLKDWQYEYFNPMTRDEVEKLYEDVKRKKELICKTEVQIEREMVNRQIVDY